jgi:hypothetical protein
MNEVGKCNKFLVKNVTKEECCHAGSTLGYTDRDITDIESFFVRAFKDSVDCMPCLGE